jgi:hypothetical protein
MAPDLQFLSFAQGESRGALCRSVSEEEWKQQKTVFSPGNDFVSNYAERRRGLERHVAENGTPRLREDQKPVIPARQAVAAPQKKAENPRARQ